MFDHGCPYGSMHTHFRENVSELSLDKSKFCKDSLFMTSVDVYDKDVELELK